MTDPREMELYAEMANAFDEVNVAQFALEEAQQKFNNARRSLDNYRAGKKQEAGK